MDTRQGSRVSHVLHLIASGVENLNFSECGSEIHMTLTCEVILINFFIDKSLCEISDLVQVSQVDLTESICFWESQLGLDLSWYERKGLSSIVLDSAWGGHMHVWSKIVIAILVHWSCLWLRLGISTNFLKVFQYSFHLF